MLHPSSLEKPSVSLAASLFDESTVAAAQFYKLPKGFTEFLQIIIRLWTMWNIRSPTKGWHKRLTDASPFQKNDRRIKFNISGC